MKKQLYDSDIRTHFKKTYLAEHIADPNTLVFDELGILFGRSRVDIAVINETLSGYEIKSEVDTFYRLPLQAKDYNRVFDQMTLIFHEKHLNELDKYSAYINHWGLIIIRGDQDTIETEIIRPPEINRNTEIFAIAHFLWMEETKGLLDKYSLPFRKSYNRRRLYNILTDNLSDQTLKSEILEIMHSRKDWRVAQAQ